MCGWMDGWTVGWMTKAYYWEYKNAESLLSCYLQTQREKGNRK